VTKVAISIEGQITPALVVHTGPVSSASASSAWP